MANLLLSIRQQRVTEFTARLENPTAGKDSFARCFCMGWWFSSQVNVLSGPARRLDEGPVVSGDAAEY